MNTVIRTITTTVLLSALLATASEAEARLKYYRYNANIPMVEMTLNMMVAMGVLEPIPGRLVHDGNPYNRYVTAQHGRYARSPYARRVSTGYYGGPGYDGFGYDRYSDWDIGPYGGYYDRAYGYDHPYQGWGGPWSNYWDSPYQFEYPYSYWDGPNVYGSPYRSWGSPSYSGWGNPWTSAYMSQWDSPWGSPWANRLYNPWSVYSYSPWASQWNNPWLTPWSSSIVNPFITPYGNLGNWSGGSGYAVPGNTGPAYIAPDAGGQGYSMPVTPTMPMSPDHSQEYMRGYAPGNTSAPAYRIPGVTSTINDGGAVNSQLRTDNTNAYTYGYRKSAAGGHRSRYRAPAQRGYRSYETKQAGRSPDRRLDGLWLTERGEMLGIRGNSFLWYDGKNRYANGTLQKTPTMMKATIAGTTRVVSMQYRLVGDELFTVSRNGKMRSFSRTPLMQQTPIADRRHGTATWGQSGSVRSFANETGSGAHRRATSSPSPMWGPAGSSAAATVSAAEADTTSPNNDVQSRGPYADSTPVPAVYRSGVGDDDAAVTDLRVVPSLLFSDALDAERSTDNTITAPQSDSKQWGPDVYRSPQRAGSSAETSTSMLNPLTLHSWRPGFTTTFTPAKFNAPSTMASADTASADQAIPAETGPAGAIIRRKRDPGSASDSQDPYPYLYSYLKDRDQLTASSLEYSPESRNIWKPNKAFPDTRRVSTTGGSGRSANSMTANYGSPYDASVKHSKWSAYNRWIQ